MDEQTAALVLTSLSCSPPPPLNNGVAAAEASRGRASTANPWTPGSHGSSGRVSSSASSTSSPSPPPVNQNNGVSSLFAQRSRIEELCEGGETKKEVRHDGIYGICVHISYI